MQRFKSHRAVLQAICDACDRADQDGHLIGAIRSARAIALEAHCHPATVWRAVNGLAAAGWLLVVSVGGRVRLQGAPSQNAVNVYAIPGYPGGLAHAKAKRTLRRWVRSADGQRRLETYETGQQATFWDPRDLDPEPPQAVASCDTPCRTVRHPLSHHATPPVARCDTTISHTTPSPKNHDHGVRPEPSPPRPSAPAQRRKAHTCPHIADVAQLEVFAFVDPPGQSAPPGLIGLYRRCVQIGLADDCEAGKLRFLATAVHARRIGKDPRRLFASIVNSGRVRTGQDLPITCSDEDEARRMLRAYRDRLSG
jgi:hypothetical protein